MKAKNLMLARSPIAARIIMLRDDNGRINDATCDRIFDALAEIDFTIIINAKLIEHGIQARGLKITVDNGETLETQPN